MCAFIATFVTALDDWKLNDKHKWEGYFWDWSYVGCRWTSRFVGQRRKSVSEMQRRKSILDYLFVQALGVFFIGRIC